jgi:hypothetical protein
MRHGKVCSHLSGWDDAEPDSTELTGSFRAPGWRYNRYTRCSCLDTVRYLISVRPLPHDKVCTPWKVFGEEGSESPPAREIYWHNSFLNKNLCYSRHKDLVNEPYPITGQGVTWRQTRGRRIPPGRRTTSAGSRMANATSRCAPEGELGSVRELARGSPKVQADLEARSRTYGPLAFKADRR